MNKISHKKYYCSDCGKLLKSHAYKNYTPQKCSSCAQNGKKHSLKTKRKISIIMSGENNPFYGKHHTLKAKQEIGLANKGRKHSLETRKKISLARKGMHHSLKTRKKISLALTGEKHPMYGKHRSLKIRKKISLGTIGKKVSLKTRKKISLGHGGTGVPYENSEYGHEFNSALKERIRFRDGYKCRECGYPQVENEYQLDIHHIDYNKGNNKDCNLISLCRTCHSKVNKNRSYWKEKFKKRMIEILEKTK